MKVVPHILVDSKKERNPCSRTVPARIEELILIDESSDGSNEEESYLDGLKSIDFKSDYEFHKQLNTLNRKNNEKLKNTWYDILKRYSQIDDEKESDEIDLATGRIVKDNGHLQSLAAEGSPDSKSNVWALDLDRYSGSDKKEVVHDNSVQKRPGLLEDYLVLNPSPTKKKRPFTGDDLRDISPTKGKVPLTYNYNSSPVKLSFDNLSLHNQQNSDLLNLELSSLKSVGDNDDQWEEPRPFSNLRHVENESSENVFEDEYLIVSEFPSYSDHKHSLYDCYFDTCDYCTGNKLLFKGHLLSQHLPELSALGYPVKLSEKTFIRSSELATIRKRINLDFPLKCREPELPSTVDNLPVICNKRMKDGLTCKRSFISVQDLKKHQEKGNKCSHKRQVFLCPILGCGYITENGYMDWREHFIKAGHVIDSSGKKDKASEDSASKLPSLNPENLLTPTKCDSISLLPRTDNSSLLHGESAVDDLDDLFSNESGLESDLNSDTESEQEET